MLASEYTYGLVEDCSTSIANALGFLQFCTKPPILVFQDFVGYIGQRVQKHKFGAEATKIRHFALTHKLKVQTLKSMYIDESM